MAIVLFAEGVEHEVSRLKEFIMYNYSYNSVYHNTSKNKIIVIPPVKYPRNMRGLYAKTAIVGGKMVPFSIDMHRNKKWSRRGKYLRSVGEYTTL